jgi:Flp pilus assembly protein TadG
MMSGIKQADYKYPERGQSLVELAISLMVILMLLMGAFEFGVAIFTYTTMRDAAQDGAVFGSINPTDTTGIQNRIIAAASDVIVINPGDITISYSDPNNVCEGITAGTGSTSGSHKIIINIVHQHPISTPLVGTMIGSQFITLQAQVTNTILSPTCP